MPNENQNWGTKDTVEAIEEVRDPDIEASNYEFWDNLDSVHPSPSKKGNNGLASLVPYLAVYKENGEIEPDEDLIEEADAKLSEEYEKPQWATKRISNIVSDSEGRPGEKESLLDNEVDGHSRILRMFENFYDEAGEKEKYNQILKDSDLSFNSSNGNISYEPKPERKDRGGENMDYEQATEALNGLYDETQSLEDHVANLSSDEFNNEVETLSDTVSTIQTHYNELSRALAAAEADISDLEEGINRYEDILDTFNDVLPEAASMISDIAEDVEQVSSNYDGVLDDLVSVREDLQAVGAGTVSYEGPSVEAMDAVDSVTDDEEFDEFLEAAERFTEE